MLNFSDPIQVYLCCTYCGAPVCPNLQGIPDAAQIRENNIKAESRGKVNKAKAAGVDTRPRQAACRRCSNPLPRCAICLATVGTESGNRLVPEPLSVDAPLLTTFDHAPAWCQTCRHGGHVGHVLAWFDEYVSERA